jgi:hypothetical protein
VRGASRVNLALSVVAGLCVAVVGLAILGSRAAIPYVSIEPEASNTISNPAIKLFDSAASGGSYVQFGGNVPISGTKYYLDCQGDDAKDGRSPSTAWRSLQKASAATLDAGDGLLLASGCTWDGTLTIPWSAITVSSYGTGAKPKITRTSTSGQIVNVTGDNNVIENIQLVAASTSGGTLAGINFNGTAQGNTLQTSIINGAYAGIYINEGATGNKIFRNELTANTMMNIRSGTNDDAGAFGILIWGSDNEVAFNAFSGHVAPSPDYIEDGAAVELFNASRNKIHHNTSTGDSVFIELGKDTSHSNVTGNVVAYNSFINTRTIGQFLVTRGAGGDANGPVYDTKVYNNVSYTSGTEGEGVVCYSGCSPNVLTLKNNILWGQKKSLYADAAFNESNNIYWRAGGSPLIQLAGSSTVSSTSKKVDPKFVTAGSDHRLQTGSPAIDAGTSESLTAGFNKDLDNKTVPSGTMPDIGAYEFGAVLAATSFTFGATGDHANDSTTTPVIRKIGAQASRPNFFLSLGDLSYGNLTEANWCKYIKDNINVGAGLTAGNTFGENYPFQLTMGGHENGIDNTGDGIIDNFAQCFPDKMNSTISPHGGSLTVSGMQPLGTQIPSIFPGQPNHTTNNYAKEYYFDYPVGAPIARFIVASPKQNIKYGGYYAYAKGDAHYNWVAGAIDDARAKGIRWVIAANHENYISMGSKSDEVGTDYFNLLVSKKVDLILQGHDHNYQRSRQLAHGTSCTAITTSSANSSCIVGASSPYEKDKGSVLVINGSGGHGHYAINGSDSQAPYFAANDGTSYGFTSYTVTDTSINGTYLAASGGTYSDSFAINAPATSPPPSPTPTPPPCPAAAPADQGSVTASINVPQTGTYKVWARIMAPDTASNSVYFQNDCGSALKLGDKAIAANQWTWVDYVNGSDTSKATATLAAGTQNIVLSADEAGVKLDRVILLSSTDNCVPTGNGDNCTGTGTPPTGKTGDLNGDDLVNVLDLSMLLTNWNKTTANLTNPKADINGDGIANVLDLSILLSKWGS